MSAGPAEPVRLLRPWLDQFFLRAGEKAHLQDLVGFGELATSTTPFALVL